MPRSINQHPLAIAAIVFLLAAATAAGLIWDSEQDNLQADRARAAGLAAHHARVLELNIERSLSATYALAALVRQGNGSITNFDAVASQMLWFYRGVSALGLSPGGVIHYVAPLSGNEKTIGFDQLQDPVQGKEARIARDTGKLTLAGPLNLVQGGLGAVGRLPVFLDDANGKPYFWGFTYVVIRFPEALVGARLPQLVDQGLNYELWRIHPDSGQKQMIAASSSTVLVAPVEQNLDLAYGNWTLSVAPSQGWGDPAGLWLKAGLGLIFSLLLGYVAMLAFKLQAHQDELEEEVAERTQALASVNDDLAGREALLRQILDTSSVAIFLVDKEGRITQANQRMAEMFGYSLDELVGNEYVALVHPAQREIGRQKMLALLTSAIPEVDLDRLYWRADQTEFWGHLTGKRFQDAGGEEQGLIGVIDDITERKQAETKLLNAQEMMRSAVGAAWVFPWEWDIAADRLVWGVSPALLLGPPHDAGSNYPDFRELVHPQDREAFLEAGRLTLTSGAPYYCEFRILATDGSLRWIAARGEVVRSADGRIRRMIGASLDITERKRLIEDLERHRDHLEEMVAERTANLAAAQAKAERLGRAKSEFLANMSHEIRTPLNAVLGMARIGARDSVGRASHQTFVRIQDSGVHLLGVINDILDFSKLDAGKLVVEQRPFALAGAIDNAVSFVTGAAREKGLHFEMSAATDLPEWVTGDAQRLQQILVNLLSNAVKFTERGELRLRVARDGEDIYFKVIDTGIGMTEAQTARLFRPFEQADSSTTRTYGGTGLGLAISRNLAHLMGGEIEVDCAPGAGCSFILRLPLPPATPDIPGHTETLAGAECRLTGLRLLAAEDVAVNRLILEDLLIHEGAHVLFAEDGRQALDRLEEAGVSAFDAVLMDVQMPVMDGLDATRRLREMAPALPVIGLTAHALAEERDKCLAAGMVEHVTKPIDVDLLVAAILRHTRAANPIPAAAPLKWKAEDAVPPAPTFAAAAIPAAGRVDWPGLLARYPGREAFVTRLAAIALDSQQNTPAELRAAAAKQDLHAMAFIAHSIKGVGGNLMAYGLQDLATRAEIAARQGEPAAVTLARELADAVTALLDELIAREAGGPTA